MNVRWVAVAVALTALAVAAPVNAANGTLTGRAELPLEVDGLHQASGSDSRFLLEGTDGEASLLIQGVDGTATRVIHRAWGYINTQNPKLAMVWDDKVDTVELPLQNALLSLDERLDGFTALAWDGGLQMSNGAYGAPLLVGALDGPKAVNYRLEDVLSGVLTPPDQSDRFQQVIPAGFFQSRSDDGRVQADGAFRLFVTNAQLTYFGANGVLESIPAHFRIEEKDGQVYNPLAGTWTGGGKHQEYVQEYLLLDAKQGLLDLQFAGAPASLYSERSVITVDGVAKMPAMDGTVTITEDSKTTRHVLRGDDLELGGRFTLRLHDVLASPARTQVEGDGDITTVTFAATAAKYDWTQTAAAAGLGALLLAGLAWAAVNAKTILGSLGGLVAGYARVSGQEILEHPGRQEVYERVKAFPGVSFVQLAQQVSFGASTLTYHLRVLEKNEYIASVRDGRYIRFFDRTAGTYSGERKHAVSALRNTTTAAMARHIKQNPGVAQCELAEKFEVTASTVTWHINRLTGAGLVTRARDAHYTRYYLAEGWSRLPLEEQARMSEPVLAAPLVVA